WPRVRTALARGVAAARICCRSFSMVVMPGNVALSTSIKKRKISAIPIESVDMSPPRITLDQWAALVAVVDAGGYAQAAEQLHKSQSSVTYAVQQLESLLDVKAFEIQGRKAVLKAAGKMHPHRPAAS